MDRARFGRLCRKLYVTAFGAIVVWAAINNMIERYHAPPGTVILAVFIALWSWCFGYMTARPDADP